MAADNKLLGEFNLDGIPPAPRGVPQIEVTFDIDANGIVNVSAKDKGTGKEQKVTITASTNLSEEEIDRAIKEAQKFEEEDKKRKEAVEIRNNADSMVFQSEKVLNDLGDKISSEEKSKIQGEIEKVKEALKGDDTDAIKNATESLQKAFYEISQKIYQQNPQGAQQDAGMGGSAGESGDAGGGQENVYEADYEVVDDEDEKK